MKKRSKIILVLSFVFVFAFSLSINIFADSASYGDDDLKPIFAPTSFMAYDSVDSVVFDLPMTVRTDDSDDNIDYVVYGVNTVSNFEDEPRGTLYYTIDYPTSSIFGTSFRPYFNFQLVYSYNRFRITFNDFFYSTPEIIDNDFAGDYLNRLFEFQPNFNNLGLPVFYTLTADITSLNSNNDVTYYTYTTTQDSIEDVISNLDSYVAANYPKGALLTNIVVSNDLNPLQGSSFSNLSFDAYAVYESLDSPSAGAKALDAWGDYFGDVIIDAPPTVIESVTRGLNSIWETSLFGTFTIGQVFSACAGFALFGWILKIFNR